MAIDYLEDRPTAVCDSECFQNYWAIAFRCLKTARVRVFEKYDGCELDRPGIAKVMRHWRIVTFNGINYDLPMISLAMSGASCAELKRASDDIILADLKPWQFAERYNCRLPEFVDHIDLMEVSPGSPTKPSLKIYAGRLHSKRMQDLPFEPDEWITPEARAVLSEYHVNDLDVSVDFYNELKPQLDLRAELSAKYNVDLRSKSDAQMAEAVIKAEIERLSGRKVYRPDINPGTFHYRPPSFIRFQTEQMRSVLHKIRQAAFVVDAAGIVHSPAALEQASVEIGDSVYKLGIGGLHSTESTICHISTDEYELLDRDVTSFYPFIILGSRLFPKHLGENFLTVYRGIVDRRIAAKKAGRKSEAESLKIVVNGSFGKFGSPFSVLYSPDLMIQTTVTGQLSILMLIEAMEMNGIKVLSANTDGFVSRVGKHQRDLFNAIIFDWECDTSFNTEETAYRALYSRDVNNYIAIPVSGKVKTKGAYAAAGPGQNGAAGMKKNPTAEITIEAVIAFLKNDMPLETTIRDCTDVRKFVRIQRVKGGAEKDGVYVGKAVRWYYAAGETGAMTYRTTGNTVPRTEGAKPLMELPDELPDDIDYDWYLREAYAILEDIGAKSFDPALAGRTGTTLARLPDQKNIHIVQLPSGVAMCGRGTGSIRTRWIEFAKKPDGHNLCSKCVKADAL